MIYSNSHSTCPYCGSQEVHVNESVDEDVDDRAYFQFWCTGCNKGYQAVYQFAYAEGDE